MTANNLTELFNSRIFRIPDYQRGYAWEEKQLSELWDDLEEIGESNGILKKHYTGTIFLEESLPNPDEKWLSGVKFYNVVDGQQRLTTISILLCELLKDGQNGYCDESNSDLSKTFLSKSNSSGESKIYKFSYSLSDKNYNFLLHSIFEDNRTVLPNGHQNLYTKNLKRAKIFFREKISNLTYEKKEIIFKKLTTALQFDIRTIKKDLDVQAVFETMNNRGKPLSTLEKLKNRLIYLTEKLEGESEDKNGLRKKINEAWGKIYNCLAQNANRILDEDIFLSAHLSLYRKPLESTFSEKGADKKVFQIFYNQSKKYSYVEKREGDEPDGNELMEGRVSYKKIEDYILKLSELSPIWYVIHNSKDINIKKILLLNNNKEIKIFISSFLLKTTDNILINSLLTKLEKILFRNRVPGNWILDERVFANWARDIYTDEDTLENIIIKMDQFINVNVSPQNISRSFKDLFTYERGQKGFHRWGALKYFLFEYETFLKNKFQESNEKVTLDDFPETTIEHIIPQHFWDNWQPEVRAVTDGLEDSEKIELVRKVFINSLGNLTILKNGKNSSLGNKGWLEKRERFRTGSYNEIAISKNENWTAKNISERGKEMLKFLESKLNGLSFSEIEIKQTLYFDDNIGQLIDK